MSSTKRKIKTWPPPATEVWGEDERALLARLHTETLPHHIAIIMDGNGRWASQKGFLDRIRGHEAGIDAVRTATRACATLGIEALTLYAFSKENWQRPRHETAALMHLLERFAIQERRELMENDIRFAVIGNLEDLPRSVHEALIETARLTQANQGTILTLALSYGGRDEIVRAAREVARMAVDGRLDPDSLDEDGFAAHLDTAGLPDPDLMIRTSGEVRISNFLLWQLAYAELHVTSVLWPDFGRLDLLKALLDFKDRDRRFGGLRVGQSKAKGT